MCDYKRKNTYLEKIMQEEDNNAIAEKHFYDFLFARCSETSDNNQNVEEALIYSYNASLVHRKICEQFNLASNQRVFLGNQSEYLGFSVIHKSNNKCSVILLALSKDKTYILKDITLKIEKAYGWFLACPIYTKNDDIECWQFEKKKINDATLKVETMDCLYHLCPTSRLQKILHVGLLPKKTTWEPYKLDNDDESNQHYWWKEVNRVYICLNKTTMKPIQDNKLEEGVFMDTYTLLEIATSKLLENTRFIFDPRHEDAVYTMANIPPTAISVYKT